jgi:predicted metal-dependent peptidase
MERNVSTILQGDFIELNVAWDTSGSMDNKELSKGLAETRGICSNFGSYLIHLYICDADCHSVIDIDDTSEIPNIVTGRGGTSFVPVFKKMEDFRRWGSPPAWCSSNRCSTSTQIL